MLFFRIRSVFSYDERLMEEILTPQRSENLVLRCCVHDIVAGSQVPFVTTGLHMALFVESGAVDLAGQRLEAGEGRYLRTEGAISVPDTDGSTVKIVTWTLLPDGSDDGSGPLDLAPARQMDHVLHPLADNAVFRLDTVTFPPGSRAFRHEHSAPGTRYLLRGSLEINTDDSTTMMQPGDPWFEPACSPVLAIADDRIASQFVRALVLPADALGKPTIRYLNPEDDDKPRLQKNDRLFDQLITLRE